MKYLRFLLIGAMTCAAMGCATSPDTMPFANYPEISRFDDFFRMADTNKDGMMSREEFMAAAGNRYDAMMVKMRKMSPEKSKTMMKGDLMTKDGAKMFVDEWKVYSGS